MAVKSHIADPQTGGVAGVLDGNLGHGVLVYAADAQTSQPVLRRFLSSDYGQEMAQDASPGGTPAVIHDGGDTAAWTGTTVTGVTADFADTARFNSGAASVSWAPTLNSVIQFDQGAGGVDLTSYVAITMYINVDRRWITDEVSFYAWDTGAGSIIGNSILLSDYFDPTTDDVWQKLTIPLADLGVKGQTIEFFRMECTVQVGTAPEFYVDDLQIEETGDPVNYDLDLTMGETFMAHSLRIVLVDNVTSTGLAYDKLMGTSFSIGLAFSWSRLEMPIFSANFDSVQTLLANGLDIQSTVTDGTNTMLSFETTFDSPIALAHPDYSAKITISEDLSSLVSAVAFMTGRVTS